MANRDQLVRAAYEVLTGDGQEPSPEDYAKIDGVIPGKLAELASPGRRVVYVADPDNFPDAYLEWLAVLVANTFDLRGFGRPISADEIQLAEMRLRSIQAAAPLYRPVRVQYF